MHPSLPVDRSHRGRHEADGELLCRWSLAFELCDDGLRHVVAQAAGKSGGGDRSTRAIHYRTMFIAYLLAASLTAAGPGADGTQPELAPLRADVAPTKFRLRTGRMFVGGQWRATLTGPNAPCWTNIGCGVSPVLGFDLESGSRTARLLTGVYTAPMPWITGGSDGERSEFLMLEVGGLFGGPNVRAGVSARFGLVTLGGTLLLRVTPLVGSRGGRHGFELRLGRSLFLEDLSVGLNYAWHIPRLERKLRRR